MRYYSIAFLLIAFGFLSGCNADSRVETLAASAIPISQRTQGIDWPRMLGPNYDQRSPETGIVTKWPPKGPRLVWTYNTGVGYGNGVSSNGRWFQFDRFGSVERLQCLNAETGEPIWKWESKVDYQDAYGYNNGPRCSPVVDGDRVYVYGVTGTLGCIAAQDGKQLWKKSINEEYNVIPNFFGVGASPLVYKDKLLVMVGGSPPTRLTGGMEDIVRAKPDGSAMVAFDKITGKELYRVGKYLASYSAPVIQSIHGKDVCLALVREGLLTFDPTDGSNEMFYPWRANTIESVNASSPIVWKDNILISECYEIGCSFLSVKDGKLVPIYRDGQSRKDQVLRSHWSTPLLKDDILIASNGRNQPDTDLRCIVMSEKTDDNLLPLNLKWSTRNHDRMTGIIVDGYALLLGENGLLQLTEFQTEKHTVIAEVPLGEVSDPKDGLPLVEGPSWAPPVLSHGLLYIRGARKLVCLELIPKT